jgi:hypothetical protein
MSIKNSRYSEALYLIIVRDKDAEKMLQDWSQQHNVPVAIDNNRMKLFEQRGLTLFQMHWNHNWNNVTIWDCWNRRHI